MIKTYSKAIIAVLAGLAVLCAGSYALAGWGYGHHGHENYEGDDGDGYGHPGYGRHRGLGMEDCPGWAGRSDLSEEKVEQLKKQRKAFRNDTEKLRDSLYQKELALKSELAKESPDAAQATKLQKDISGLRAEIDQKRLEHLIEVRKIDPDAGKWSRKGYGRGGGSGMGGPCWR